MSDIANAVNNVGEAYIQLLFFRAWADFVIPWVLGMVTVACALVVARRIVLFVASNPPKKTGKE